MAKKFKPAAYEESDNLKARQLALDNLQMQKPQSWTGGQYGQQLNDTMNRINNREKFSYDVNADALYQQYKNQYMTQGFNAMQDTMGQAAALTGGYGNSYAATAGNQAYQGYLGQLNNVIPELYNLAYQRYNQEGQDLMNQYNMYSDAYGRDYGEYRDNMSDWNVDYDRAYQQFSDDRNFEYGKYSDDWNRALQKYQINTKKGRGGGGGGRSGGSRGYDSGGLLYDDAKDDTPIKKSGTGVGIKDMHNDAAATIKANSIFGTRVNDIAETLKKKKYRTGNKKANQS